MPSAAGLARTIYDHSPAFLRGAVGGVPFGWRIGRTYRTTLRFLLQSDVWGAEQHRAYQTERLDALLDGAIRRVPFYGRYHRLLGRPALRILSEMEPIDKQTVQADPERFLNPAVPADRTYRTSTGGTTGEPLKIILNKAGFQIEWAFMVCQWMRAGFRPGMSRATFRGVSFPRGGLWQANPVYDELQFSPFAMSPENLGRYVQKLQQYRPDFLYGYPSALTILARHYEMHPDVPVPKVKGLLCGSENIRPGQREYLAQVFKARPYSWYGMSEKVVLAGECERSTLYHAFPQYGITEIIDRASNVSQAVGVEGELVGTGFMNTAMPLIRYRLGDHASIEAHTCDSCGRAFTVLGPIEGRWRQEMLVGRGGGRISLTALNMHGEVFKGVMRFQFHQQAPGCATLYLVVGDNFNEARDLAIKKALHDKTGDQIDWTVTHVEDLPLSPRGKSLFLVQEIEGADSLVM